MKKLVLSMMAMAAVTTMNAQIAADDFSDDDASNVTIAGNFTVTEANGQLDIATSGGHDEWESVIYTFDPPISITEDDSIKLTIKAEVDAVNGIMPVLTVIVGDTAGIQNQNQAMQDQRTTLTTQFVEYIFTAADFNDTWVNAGSVVDGSVISTLTLSPNRGFGSFPHTNASGDDIASFYTGTISIQNLEIGSSASSVEDAVLNTSVSIFPNPSTDLVNIAFGQMENAVKINVVDMLGNVVTQQLVAKGTANTELSFDTPGVYFLNITDGVASKTEKVVIK